MPQDLCFKVSSEWSTTPTSNWQAFGVEVTTTYYYGLGLISIKFIRVLGFFKTPNIIGGLPWTFSPVFTVIIYYLILTLLHQTHNQLLLHLFMGRLSDFCGCVAARQTTNSKKTNIPALFIALYFLENIAEAIKIQVVWMANKIQHMEIFQSIRIFSFE